MKKIILIPILLFCVNCVNAQPNVSVDERFELTGVAFRLTGDEIFIHKVPENYVADIDSCFSKYKDHELVRYLRKMIEARKRHFDFSVIADLAADVEITPKGIVWTRKWEAFYESEEYSQRDNAWSRAELKEYLRLLNKFYKDTKFHQFFVAHSSFYAVAEENMRQIVGRIDTAWFSDFFGQPFSLENVWVVPANGRHNFSLNRTDARGVEHHHCVMGFTGRMDSMADLSTFTALIHEICHNYNNPVCDRYHDSFQTISDSIYPYVMEDLNYRHYGYESILYEGMNRLCEYAYYQAHHTMDSATLKEEIIYEELSGFIWLGEMLDYLKVFYLNRDRFPNYEAFMPQLVEFMHQVVDIFQRYYMPKRKMYNLLWPQVIATYPANGSVVDTNLSKVIIMFSRPMCDASIVCLIDNDSILPLPLKRGCMRMNEKGEWEYVYERTECVYWKDPYTYVLPLSEPLKPKSRYGFYVNGRYFTEKQYFFGTRSVKLIFETK